MTHDMLHVTEWHNGEKRRGPFSDAEMSRRQSLLRRWMAAQGVDAVLVTSHHGIGYLSGWLCGSQGRNCGMVITQTAATTISPGVEGGRPWRQGFGGNITYTDWRRDNFHRALRQLTAGVRRLGIEMEQVSAGLRQRIEAALPGVEVVDAGTAVAAMQAVASAEEQAVLREAVRIAMAGADAAIDAIRDGAVEYEVAGAASRVMEAQAALAFPFAELAQGWGRFVSGVGTDGAAGRSTGAGIRRGEPLSLACFPVLHGYRAGVQRTLFLGEIDDARRIVWERNLAVHRRAMELIRPGARCSEIAAELNDMNRNFGLLRHRTFAYGRVCGITGLRSVRDGVPELREDCDADLQSGMVVSVEPMVMLPEGMPGAGGYREHDVLIVTDTGAEVLTGFRRGPEENLLT